MWNFWKCIPQAYSHILPISKELRRTVLQISSWFRIAALWGVIVQWAIQHTVTVRRNVSPTTVLGPVGFWSTEILTIGADNITYRDVAKKKYRLTLEQLHSVISRKTRTPKINSSNFKSRTVVYVLFYGSIFMWKINSAEGKSDWRISYRKGF
jgi:hypothetical protein